MFNLIAYSIYLPVTAYITVKVGWICYVKGEQLLAYYTPQEPVICSTVNRLLLMGYYLLNIGYLTVTVSFWQPLTSLDMLVGTLSAKIGMICCILGCLHMINIWMATKLPYLIKKH